MFAARRSEVLVAAAVLALLLAAAIALAGPPRDGGSQDAQVEIEQCREQPDPGTEPSGCEVSSARLEREPARPRRQPSAPARRTRDAARTADEPRPRAARRARPERHDVDLRKGVDTVERADGMVETTLDDDLKVRDSKTGRDKDGPDDENGADAADVKPKEALATVATDGGSPFAGFGSELVSTDEALARFAIPPFLVPIYVAAGRAYDVPWNVLASINQIETDFGRIRRQVSSAGAMGWMQFMPGTWKAYGVDASGDGVADPYNPVDAIYAAARYLRASGAPRDLRRAVFAYNRAGWYVDSVLKTASVYGALPGGLVTEAGSLAFGRFPVRGRVSYGDDFRRARDAGRPARGLTIRARPGAAAVATQSVTVRRVLLDRDLARAFRRRSLRERGLRRASVAPAPPLRLVRGRLSGLAKALSPLAKTFVRRARTTRRTPLRPGDLPRGYGTTSADGIAVIVEDAVGNRYRYSGITRLQRGARPGARLRGGQAIGRLPSSAGAELLFSVQAAGGAAVDPRPLVDGYRLLEVADFYNAVAPLGGSPFVPAAAADGSIVRGGQRELARRVLADPGIDIYPGGRQDIARGIIDRRVLGALLYLRRSGLEPTVSSLRSGHTFYTAGGNVSAHSFGAAVDIPAFNGQPALGNQGPGSLVEQAIKLLMGLDGAARPAQLISLMELGGPSFALSDHNDHLHVGYPFERALGLGRSGNALGQVTFDGTAGVLLGGGKADERDERALSRKLGAIANPRVPRRASSSGLRVEAEDVGEAARARQLAVARMPLRAAPTAAGADIIDIDVPAGARGDEAYALGTVDGRTRGWGGRQVVLLGHRGGRWSVLATPRDRRGRVVNPRLSALATVRGGRGYAVGPRGRIVRLRGAQPAVLLPRVTRAELRAIDVERAGGRLRGVAAGASGVTVDLLDRSATRRRAVRGASFFGVALARGRAVAVGERRGAPVALRSGATGWRALPPLRAGGGAFAPDGAGRLTAVAASDGGLWVAGGLSDGAARDRAPSVPLAARLRGGRWHTFCAGRPALASVRELGSPSRRGDCAGRLALEPGAPGAAGDVAVTRRGVVVATPGGAQLFDGRAFAPLPAAPGTWGGSPSAPAAPTLALFASGRGWSVAPGGRVARVTGAGAGADRRVTRTGVGDGAVTAVAAQQGGRALAVGPRGGAIVGSGRWAPVKAPPAAIREVAAGDDGEAWAVTQAGALVRLAEGRWSDVTVEEEDRPMTSRLLGDGDGDGASRASGINAIAFDGAGEGYAVGAGGRILRFDGDEWRTETDGNAGDLAAVAAAGGRAVAAGAGGAVLERRDGRWERRADATALTAGRDLVAAAALADGTLLVAGGGAMLVRGPDDAGWRVAPLPPLGLDVRSLSAARTADGALQAVVLAGAPEAQTALVGDAAGWRPLETSGLDRVRDAAVADDGTLWLGGVADGKAMLAQIDLEATEPQPTESRTGGEGGHPAARGVAAAIAKALS